MPIPVENEVIVPNAVYAPQIILQMGISNGKLVSSAQIVFAGAKVIDAGLPTEQWISTGQTQVIHIADIMNLEADLAALAPQVETVYSGIVSLLAAINSIRKVL